MPPPGSDHDPGDGIRFVDYESLLTRLHEQEKLYEQTLERLQIAEVTQMSHGHDDEERDSMLSTLDGLMKKNDELETQLQQLLRHIQSLDRNIISS